MASISDEAVKSKTGKDWKEWFHLLDQAGAAAMTHRDIARWLAEHHEVSPWWCQSITVEYERERGLRQVYEKQDGFAASVSRTLPLPVSAVFRAWADGKARRQWLPGATIRVTTAAAEKSLRFSWNGGSRVVVHFYPKSEARTQVVVQHEKLPDSEAVAAMKQHWREAIGRLEASLRPQS